MKRALYSIVIAMLLTGCRAKREVQKHSENVQAVSIESLRHVDSLRDTLCIDFRIRLKDADISIEGTQVIAAEAEVAARVGRRRDRVITATKTDTVYIERQIKNESRKQSRPTHTPIWTYLTLAAAIATIIVIKRIKQNKQNI